MRDDHRVQLFVNSYELRCRVSSEARALIRRMALENPMWGAPRIHGELLKLGVQVCQATAAKYMARTASPPSQSWRTFLTNHVQQIVAADCFVVPTATYRLLFVLVILAHGRRRIVHVAVTRHPTAAWTAQQLRSISVGSDADVSHPRPWPCVRTPRCNGEGDGH